jgi:hypothetical protein
VEKAANAGVQPSFPIPNILPTRIATTESFGIIPVPFNIVQQLGFQPSSSSLTNTGHISSQNVLTQLSTAPVSPYTFLALCQHTAFPVVPVHTSAEFDLFTKMLKTAKYFVANSKQPIAARASRNVDFKIFAKDWTNQVHLAAGEQQTKDQHIYYKLPEQLEHHYQVWAASRARAATLTNTVQMRQPFTTIISDSSRLACVLPAIDLIDSNTSASSSQLQKGKGQEMEAPQRSGISGMIESSNVPTLTNSDQTVLSMVPEAMPPIMQEHATAPPIVTRNILPPVPHGLGSSHLQLSHFSVMDHQLLQPVFLSLTFEIFPNKRNVGQKDVLHAKNTSVRELMIVQVQEVACDATALTTLNCNLFHSYNLIMQCYPV